MTDADRTIERVARSAYGRLVAYLSAQTRDLAAAEDALGEALLDALASWRRDGVPARPAAWLLVAARHRLADQQRRTRTRERHLEVLQTLSASADPQPGEDDAVPDARLALMFVCAHPAIDPALRAPLMLQTVLGLDAARIAPMFLLSPEAMRQRLVRVKARIRAIAIPFAVPDGAEIPRRLASVLEAVYAAYGLANDGITGADDAARELADEAIWLARVLVQRVPDEPEAKGLLALMLHCESRRGARRNPGGDYVPLSRQDVGAWSEATIREAEAQLAAAAGHGRHRGRFQLEAAIQSVHADRRRTERTDWAAIAMFYEHLVTIAPTLGALVGRAVAIGECSGAAAGLAQLDQLAAQEVATYQPYWAARTHLLRQLGGAYAPAAAAARDRAVGLAQDAAIRRFLLSGPA